MDVLSLDITRLIPRPEDPEPRPAGIRPLRTWLASLERAWTGRGGPSGPDDAVAATRRNPLLGYTAAQILVGLGLLAWATIAVPIFPGINPGLDGTALAGTSGGVLLWTMFGLLGSVRSITNSGNQVHFTYNMPFVGAAMVLGGPTAGAWVAFLSTIERRELESLPWYAIVANHAAIVIAAIAGGIAVAFSGAVGLAATGDPQTALFVSIIVGGVVLEVVANLIATITVMLRDQVSRSGALTILVEDFGRATLLEIGLIWILAIAFLEVGWWAPLIVGAVVVAVSSGSVKAGRDALTDLIRKPEFDARLERKVGWMRRGVLKSGTVMYLDLDDFHLVNNKFGHGVGDELLVVVADRLRQLCPRQEDLVSRLMGDEFGLFFAGMGSPEVAMRKAHQIVESICRPIPTSIGPVAVSAAVGVHVERAWGGVPSGSTLLRWAEQAMYIAKRAGDPCGGAHLHSPDDASPFDGEWAGREDR